jgi:flagellar hook protein FlgE
MQDALRIGLSGMKAAEAALAVRARNISNLNTKGYRPVEPVEKSADGGVETTMSQAPLAPETSSALGDIPAEGDHLVEDMVGLKTAQTAYKASAAVVRTADEMSQEAINIIS